MEERKLRLLKSDIQEYFKFLFDRKYEYSDVIKLAMGDWMVFLQSTNNSIVIFSDQDEFDLGFAPKNASSSNFIAIRGIIYFLTNGETIIGRYQKTKLNKRKNCFLELSNLVEKYHDQITPYFGDDFYKYQLELFAAGRKYSNYIIDSERQKQRINIIKY